MSIIIFSSYPMPYVEPTGDQSGHIMVKRTRKSITLFTVIILVQLTNKC